MCSFQKGKTIIWAFFFMKRQNSTGQFVSSSCDIMCFLIFALFDLFSYDNFVNIYFWYFMTFMRLYMNIME